MRLPTIYIPHGGGPWPFVKIPMGKPEEWDSLREYLSHLYERADKSGSLKAVLCVTAHWEAAVPTVGSSPSPAMLYDYGGFAPEAYEIKWPAPGDPKLAKHVQALLTKAGIENSADGARGFDHGTFVPLKLADPGARIPTVQLSLKRGLDPAAHLAIGRALSPLRDEGVLIVGSGSSYHNMRGFGSAGAKTSASEFDTWLATILQFSQKERESHLLAWEGAPSARACHPREEHLLPLHVVAGAGGSNPVSLPFRSQILGVPMLAAQFG